MNQDLVYRVQLTPDPDGGYVVTFPDGPEAIAQGEALSSALTETADALEEAVAGRIRRGEQIPVPSTPGRDEPVVHVPALTENDKFR